MGYSLVRVRLFEGGQLRLQVMAEREANGTMTVDDCATLSRALSAVLDVENPIGESYDLEISSPGIDRPLVGPDDYERFNGFEAKLETALLIDGRRRFRGRLRGFDGDTVRIALRDGSEANVPLTAIRDAKLMLTDDLVKASLNAAETTDE